MACHFNAFSVTAALKFSRNTCLYLAASAAVGSPAKRPAGNRGTEPEFMPQLLDVDLLTRLGQNGQRSHTMLGDGFVEGGVVGMGGG